MNYRSQLKESDVRAISEIVKSTGFFSDSEIDIAEELAQENLSKGPEKSGYIFNVAEKDKVPVAYTCYGPIPGTRDSFDLYWIAVHKSQRGKGIGKRLMEMAVEDITRLSGKNIWIETSSRAIYEPTIQFYLKCGCIRIAQFPDFYAQNDHKLVFLKKI
ncbi:MAG: GNAT family N-acetyltransferase [Proteobacteria bacterium]|nr:GNAT family N-acetyltransferase [Pseudomonadota bacterium]MBU1387388.1 GNAT family N-acetyltransferase [Pseudomonadota bacterium]MBU1541673.1 GNAT family N-acetyltransferase [Pseudomonadota bacterium]MBU2482060.1 GNAT family N-acetyltransferase [Pseudomonadota bacterium]